MRRIAAIVALATGWLAAACGPVPTAEAQPSPPPLARGGEWFKQTGCTDCHSISAYGMWNVAAQGPDLSLAVEDVPHRFGRTLEEFFHAPSGTMAMVLSSRIPLTEAQRDVAIAKLHEAYRKHQGLPEPIRPSPSH